MSKSKNNYVSNKKLYQEMVVFKEARQRDPNHPIPRYVGECFMLISTRLATKSNFSGYSYKDEMISDAIENCVLYIDNFDPNKTNNPFAYFTQIIYNAFIRRIQKEKKQQYVKYKNMQDYQLTEQLNNNTVVFENNEVVNVFIKNFEATVAEKKVKQKGLDLVFSELKEAENERTTLTANNSGLDHKDP